MDLEELKHELNLCTEKEQDSLAAYLLYLRLKRKPKALQDLHHKVLRSKHLIYLAYFLLSPHQ